MSDPTASLAPASPTPSWVHRLYFETCYLGFMAAATLGFSLRLKGQKHLPRTGPALIIANHQSFLDPPLVGLAARRELVYLARKTLFRNRPFTAFIRSLGAVPIDQEGIGKEGLKTIAEQLQQGRAVLVFPEGERTPHGRMLPLKPGIHLLIKRTHAPIVPVGIAGAYEAWPRWRRAPIPAPLFCPTHPGGGSCAVVIGKPLDARRYAELPRAQALEELFDKIHQVQCEAERLRRR